MSKWCCSAAVFPAWSITGLVSGAWFLAGSFDSSRALSPHHDVTVLWNLILCLPTLKQSSEDGLDLEIAYQLMIFPCIRPSLHCYRSDHQLDLSQPDLSIVTDKERSNSLLH